MDYSMTFGVMAGKKGETVAASGNECIRNPIECSHPVSWNVNKKFSVLYAMKQRRQTEEIEGIRLHQ
jgi:isoaspartyl peptidase/L-asparaginase-like protein (Ntn-hydrolase superfamily)